MPKTSKSSTTTEQRLQPVSPGEMLLEEYLKPLGLTNYRLAKEVGVPAQRIGEIIAGRRSITADTDLRLCRFLGLSDGWWLRLQVDFDTRLAKAELEADLARITPWKETLRAASKAFVGSDDRQGDAARKSKRLLRKHFRGK